jgi:hypothetical protein
MSENSNSRNDSTKKISLEEGRRLATQIFDRPRPKPQKLSAEDRKKLDDLLTRASELLKKYKR